MITKVLAATVVVVAAAALAGGTLVKEPVPAEIVGKPYTCPVCGTTGVVKEGMFGVKFQDRFYPVRSEACFKKLVADPEAYAARLVVRDHAVQPSEVGYEAQCPVTGKKFTVESGTFALDFVGKTYYFCCGACIKSFRADPSTYVLKAKERSS